MKVFLATTFIASGALLASGCATKKYVRNTTAPIQAKVDQVGEQTTQNTAQINDTRNQLKQVDERAQSGISAAQERAAAADQHAQMADQHAGDAMSKANQAAMVGDQNAQGLIGLRRVVANIDDYKMQTTVSVAFKFDKYVLSPEAQQDLDKLAEDVKSDKRFYIAVEGYTDNVGSRQYNDALSRRRADAVVQYLVTKHEIPIYRIHMIGLGQERPVEEGRTSLARAKNRRVEVKVFTADQVTAGLADTSATANRSQQQEQKER